MRFEMRVRALAKDGTVEADSSGLHVSNATEVMLLLSAATSFNGYDKCPDKEGKNEDRLAKDYMDKASVKSWQNLLDDHRADFHRYFDRVSFILKDTAGGGVPPPEQRKTHSPGGSHSRVYSLYSHLPPLPPFSPPPHPSTPLPHHLRH